jgi:hypothetical protein
MSKELKVCPVCKNEYTGEPALSRKDNKTEICPNCGQQEAMNAMNNATKEKVKFNFTKDIYTREDCVNIDTMKDCTGMILVLRPDSLHPKYRESKYQLWKATGGFGTKNYTIGTAVFGKGLYDGESARWNRSQFMGALNDECVKELYGDNEIPKEELPSNYKEEQD